MCPRMWSARSGRRRTTRRCFWMRILVPQASVRKHSANARGIGYEEETSPTLRAGVVPAAIALDYHPADSRIGIGEPEKIQTLTSRMGDRRNNVPLVMDGKAHQELPPQTLKIRSGCEGGGKGAQVQVENPLPSAAIMTRQCLCPTASAPKPVIPCCQTIRILVFTKQRHPGRLTRMAGGRTAPRAGSRLSHSHRTRGMKSGI